jgi:hypothetical protein
MSTRKTPEGKDGWCVGMTTLPPSYCRKSRQLGSLNLPDAEKPVEGKLYQERQFQEAGLKPAVTKGMIVNVSHQKGTLSMTI